MIGSDLIDLNVFNDTSVTIVMTIFKTNGGIGFEGFIPPDKVTLQAPPKMLCGNKVKLESVTT
jgi:hypothetical protein